MSLTEIAPPLLPARLGVRRLPVRRADPPYDDELDSDHAESYAESARRAGEAVAQGALALAFGVDAAESMPGQVAGVRPGLLLVPPWTPPGTGRTPPRTAPTRAGGAAQRAGQVQLGCPASWAGRFTQALVEVLAGDRPLAQLTRWTSIEVYADLQRRVLVTVAPAAGRRRPGSGTAGVRRVHVDEPGDGVAEIAAVVRSGSRCRALALRLEGVNGRWVCTALELG